MFKAASCSPRAQGDALRHMIH